MSPIKRTIPALLLSIAGATLAASGVALAQEAHYLSNDASTCEIFRHVSREVPRECGAERPAFRPSGMRTRSIVVRRKIEDAAVEVGANHATEPVFEAGVSNDFSIALRSQFEFDSFLRAFPTGSSGPATASGFARLTFVELVPALDGAARVLLAVALVACALRVSSLRRIHVG